MLLLAVIMLQYTNLSDEELVVLIRSGNDDAFKILYERYLPRIKAMTYSFQGLSYEIDDLVQEATLGFYTAINAFDESQASFSSFSYLCMRRMLIALLKKSARKKEIPNNCIVRLEDFSLAVANDPAQIIIANEDFKSLKDKIFTELSQLERDVLFKFINGCDYNTIANECEISYKSVDNAIQRVKKKLQK